MCALHSKFFSKTCINSLFFRGEYQCILDVLDLDTITDGPHVRPKKKQCGKTFKWIQNLRAHQHLHSGQKPFKCSYCSTRFATKGNRDEHEGRHAQRTKYRCHVNNCRKEFYRLQHTLDHIRKMHRQDRYDEIRDDPEKHLRLHQIEPQRNN